MIGFISIVDLIFRSLDLIEESEDQNHLQDIEKILEKDKRYLTLEVIPEERTNILMNYLQEMKQNGVPPPPTASIDRKKMQKTVDRRKMQKTADRCNFE